MSVPRVGERSILDLRRRVVMMVQEVVDLDAQLQMPRQIVVRREVDYRITGGNSGPQIIHCHRAWYALFSLPRA